MTLVTLYRTDDGVSRLLAQPKDIVGPYTNGSPSRTDAAESYHVLFARYREDLGTAYGIAMRWWEDTVAAQERLGKTREEAIEESFDRRLAGAASHPKVIWIVRSYWLACANAGSAVTIEQRVPPEEFLLRWLVDAGETELVRLVACMPYWPVGLEKNGNWS